ncbi:MAG: hypothetical protein AAGD38_06805 [Acidobacteriota bacterium]
MSSIVRRSLVVTVVIALAAVFWVSAPTSTAEEAVVPPGFTTGKAELRSATRLTFGPDDVLFVGDAKSASLFAFQTDDQPANTPEEIGIQNLDATLAGHLGVTPRDIAVNDMAVHPVSKAIYLAVERGQGEDAVPVILRMAADGSAIEPINLDNIAHARADLPKAPAADAKDRWGRDLRAMTITDLDFFDGKVWVSGLSNEEFASHLRIVPFPFDGTVTSSSLEIFHGAHGRWETASPARTLLPIDIDGEPHILAAYTCTPLAVFKVADLKDGAHVKGKTVAELGNRNQPIELLVTEVEGEPQVLVLNSTRAGMRIKVADIAKAAAITERENEMTWGTPYVPMPFGATRHFSDFDEDNLLLLRRSLTDGSLYIHAWPKNRLAVRKS